MLTESQKATIVYFILGKPQTDEGMIAADCLVDQIFHTDKENEEAEEVEEGEEGEEGEEAEEVEGTEETEKGRRRGQMTAHDDSCVTDGGYTDNPEDTFQASWNLVLPCGESVLERQLRMLSALGICDFVLSSEDYQQESAEILTQSLRGCLPAVCRVRCIAWKETVQDIKQALSEDGEADSAVLLSGCAIYDRRFARKLIEAESGSAFLSKNAVNRQYAGQFARIDFKSVRELGNADADVRWFPVLHIYKLGADQASVLETADNPVQAVEDRIGQLELKPVFDTGGYVRIPEDTVNLSTAYREVLMREYRSRRILRRKACIVNLPDWLDELQVRKPLLICDQAGRNTPVADVMKYLSIPFAQASVGELPDRESLSDLLKLCREEQCDGVISVGGMEAVYTAKLLRACCMFQAEPAEDMKLYRSVRRFPLISVPLTEEAEQIDIEQEIPTPGIGRLSPVHMIPELTILDPILSDRKKEDPAFPKEKPINVKKGRPGLTRIVKSVLRPFPGVLRRLRLTYKKALFAWYRHRYVIRNQAVTFSSFQGSQAYCNPRGIYEAMRNAPEYNGFQYIWAVKKPQKYKALKNNPDTQVVKYGSRRHLRALATSRYIVDNVRLPKFVKLYPEQVYIQTWHGKPIKHIGQDVISKTSGGNGSKENRRIFSHDAKMITHLCVPSEAFVPFFTSAYNLKALGRESIVRVTGYPRNDSLFGHTEKDVLRTKLILGIPLNKKVILYAPTWRPVSYEKGTGYIYHSTVDFRKLHEQLGDEYVIMFRAHINEAKSVDFSSLQDFVLDVTKVADVNDLLMISDLLISDYSGIIFDYANLCRPIVLYQYDRDAYVNDLTGVYFDLDEIPGRVVKDPELLSEAIRDEIRDFRYDEKYQHFNEKYNTLDGADCGIRMVRELISPDVLKSERQQKQEKRLDFYQGLSTRVTGFLRTTGLKRTRNDKKLLSFKGKHKGERCFLVGNGPSLRLEDLEAIRYEYSFACNRIYKSFDRTNWRPTYYCFTDNVFSSELGQFRKAFRGTLFSNNTYNKSKYRKYRFVCAHSIKKEHYTVHGNMLGYYVPSNATVMTFMIELAMYMGFSEIYLIGVDCSNGFVNTSNHFMSGYMTDEMEKVEQRRMRNLAKGSKKLTPEELGQYRVDRSMEAYDKLRVYADKHHIKVFNATRGGYLEAFERVDLDSLTFKQNIPKEPEQSAEREAVESAEESATENLNESAE